MKLPAISAALLAAALTTNCALVEASEPSLPPDSETIVMEHADAREVAATLNRLIESARWKAASGNCVLGSPRMARSWSEITGNSVPAGIGMAPDSYIVSEQDPTSLLALDRRTLVVLDAHRTDDYLELIRDYVATLDVPPNDE